MATACMFWLSAQEEGLKISDEVKATRCGKNATWRFGDGLDFCDGHYDTVSAGLSQKAAKNLGVRAIR